MSQDIEEQLRKVDAALLDASGLLHRSADLLKRAGRDEDAAKIKCHANGIDEVGIPLSKELKEKDEGCDV